MQYFAWQGRYFWHELKKKTSNIIIIHQRTDLTKIGVLVDQINEKAEICTSISVLSV